VAYMEEGRLARFSHTTHPVAREDGLLVEQVADEMVIYDNASKEAHCLSPLAAVVFAHCDGRTTIEELAVLATDRLAEPVDQPGVIEALAQLQERDLLAVPPRDGLSRRQMIGKSAAAAGALAGASLITSVMAPGASAQNGTLVPPGGCCGPLSPACNGNNHICQPPPGQQDGHCCQFQRDCNKCKCVADDNDCNDNQCTPPGTGCPNVLVDGVSTAACGRTSGGQCCYPDADNPTACCRGFVVGGGISGC
jgi:hypothetical protein